MTDDAKRMHTLQLPRQEFAWMLGALRHTSMPLYNCKTTTDGLGACEVFTDAGALEPATADGIALVADRLNAGGYDAPKPDWSVELPELPGLGGVLAPVLTDKPYSARYELFEGAWRHAGGTAKAGVIIPAPSLAQWANAEPGFVALLGIVDVTVHYTLWHCEHGGASYWVLWQGADSAVGFTKSVRLSLPNPPPAFQDLAACGLGYIPEHRMWHDKHACHPSVLA